MKRRAALLTVLLAGLVPAGSSAAPRMPRQVLAQLAAVPKLRGPVPLFFARRDRAPVAISLTAPADAAAVADLERAGAVIARRSDGRPRGAGSIVLASVSPDALAAVAALDRVVAIEPDGSPFAAPAPLDLTGAEIEAHDVWRSRPDGLPLAGQGMTVCDIDSGIDVLHPLFFRADAGLFSWRDADENGRFDRGVDEVDIDGQPVVLRVLNGFAYGPSSPEAILGTDSLELEADLDWLYADLDGSGQREAGRAAGFDDATPAFGEPLFVVDDVDGDGELDVGEKLARLGSSKIRTVWFEDQIYARGQNLIDAPPGDAGHGSGASGVMVAGQRGYGRVVGIAPEAELVFAARTSGDDGQLAMLTDFCIDQGARVVLHEYAPWQGYFLDGSSALERFIDVTSEQGIAHINPAGNLSGSQKLYKRDHPAGQVTDIAVEVPEQDYRLLGISVLWRDPRAIAFTIEGPTGHSQALGVGPGQELFEWHSGLSLYAFRGMSERGTQRIDVYLFSMASQVPIPTGSWVVHAADPAAPSEPPVEVIAYVQDERSGWGLGAHFPDHSSEDHLIGHPGTADGGIAVSATTGHGYWGGEPGYRAPYSGRGVRIDGAAILSIAAPDDPLSVGYVPDIPATYFTFGGTSGASPHVAGAAALLLEAHPTWTGQDVRQAIREGALADAAVGPAPNPDYGYGKLRIYRSLYGTDPPGGDPPVIEAEPQRAIADATSPIAVIVSDPDEAPEALRVELDRDYDGVWDEAVTDGRFEVRYPDPGRRWVKLRAVDSTGRETKALLAIDVVDPDVSVRLLPSGGLACGIAARPAPAGWLGWATAALLVWRRRRR